MPSVVTKVIAAIELRKVMALVLRWRSRRLADGKGETARKALVTSGPF
jgi:hypothetical protein